MKSLNDKNQANENLDFRIDFDGLSLKQLISLLDESAKQRILAAGIFVEFYPSENEADFGLIQEFENPDYFGTPSDSFTCPKCNLVLTGALAASMWAVDDDEEFHEQFCGKCALEYLDDDTFIGLTNEAFLQTFSAIESLKKNQNSQNLHRCNFGDEDVHVHKFKRIPRTRRIDELTALEYYDAWIIAGETDFEILYPNESLHDVDFDIKFSEFLILNLKNRSKRFMDCSDWLNLLDEVGDKELLVHDDISASYVMSFESAANDFKDSLKRSSSVNYKSSKF